MIKPRANCLLGMGGIWGLKDGKVELPNDQVVIFENDQVVFEKRVGKMDFDGFLVVHWEIFAGGKGDSGRDFGKNIEKRLYS